MHGAATRAHLGVRQLAVHVGQEADHGRVGGDADLLQRLQPGPQRAGHEELQQALVAERERWRETEDPTAAHPPPNSDGLGLKDPPPRSQGVINGGGGSLAENPPFQTNNKHRCHRKASSGGFSCARRLGGSDGTIFQRWLWLVPDEAKTSKPSWLDFPGEIVETGKISLSNHFI